MTSGSTLPRTEAHWIKILLGGPRTSDWNPPALQRLVGRGLVRGVRATQKNGPDYRQVRAFVLTSAGVLAAGAIK